MENPIMVGCNYHTIWQSNKAMRFILAEVRGDKARLTTRITKKSFWTETSSLVFIKTEHNIWKYKQLSGMNSEQYKNFKKDVRGI